MVQRFLAPGGDPSPSAVELRLRALTMQTWGHVLPLGAMGGCSLGVPTATLLGGDDQCGFGMARDAPG